MAKKKVKQITRVALVIDRSGSMNVIANEAKSGLKEQLEVIRRDSDKCDATYVTVVSFDDRIDVHHDNINVNKLPDVDADKILIPRGMTAMNDAVLTAIKTLRAKRTTPGTAYLVVVISDGLENASKTTSQELSKEIEKLQETGKWTFSYMLANQDIYKVMKDLGLKEGNVSAFTANSVGTTIAYDAMNDSTSHYFSLRGSGVLSTDTFYDPKEKKKVSK